MTSLLLLLALSAPLQSAPAGTGGLQDGQVAVVTTAGLFLAQSGQPTLPLVSAQEFGFSALCDPSITWIEGSGSLLVSSGGLCGQLPGLFRVDVLPGPVATVVDLTPAIIALAPIEIVDADYSRTLDRAWLLDRAGSRLLAWDQPLLGDPADVVVLQSLFLDGPESVAQYGAVSPGTVIVTGRNQVQKLQTDGTIDVLWDGTLQQPLLGFEQVDDTGMDSEYYVLDQQKHLFGTLAAIGSATISFNLSASCTAPMRAPADMEWDPTKARTTVIGADGIDCMFGGALSGKPNHVMRFRKAIIIGNPNSEPQLVTPFPDSGITGTQPDLALVRFDKPAVTTTGVGFPAADGTPVATNAGALDGKLEPGGTASWAILSGPPSAPAFLLISATGSPQPVAGKLLYPENPLIFPFSTAADGTLGLQLPIPNSAVFVGWDVWTQWWVKDTTAPGGGWATSWATILSIGV